MHTCKHCKKEFATRGLYEAHLSALITYHGTTHRACPEQGKQQAEADRRFGQPHHGHDESEPSADDAAAAAVRFAASGGDL